MMEYQSLALMYDRVFKEKQIPVNKSDTTWSWLFNTPCRFLKGISVLLKWNSHTLETQAGSTTQNVLKVSVIIEDKPNQLYAQGM